MVVVVWYRWKLNIGGHLLDIFVTNIVVVVAPCKNLGKLSLNSIKFNLELEIRNLFQTFCQYLFEPFIL